MNISYEWLRTLVPTDLSAAEVGAIITAQCAPVDEVVALREDLSHVVVARVIEAERHPNSDRLWVTKVDAGGTELLDVVCGAQNVRAGKLYPFAHTGTVLPGGVKLEKKKIRGAVSNGMLCSARELGLGEEHDGILELEIDAAPGTPFLEAVPVGDTRIVIDSPPNRPDLLSHLGVAREVAAATGIELKQGSSRPALVRDWVQADREAVTAGVTVRLEDPEGAPRYMGVVIRGVTIGPSPDWLRTRLEAVGSRSINNVVDVTNYLLHELGQPMHAFDLATLAGPAIIVRRARAGERVRTLDGVERSLTPPMTVIADAERAQAVAGVMGGAPTEVGPSTRDLFLEVALFDPGSVRATRRALGMTTDASYRFERGVDPELQPRALVEAAAMLIDLAGGRIDGTPVDVGPRRPPRDPIILRASRVGQLLGVPVPVAECAALLRSIGFDAHTGTGDELSVTAPSWRRDIEREVDLIEEVARLRGYGSFPDELRPYRPGTTTDAPLVHVTRRIRTALIGAGLYEARPMPFVVGAESGFVRVTNPLADDEAYLRRSILDSLARRAEHNLGRMQGNVRLFEVGDVFAPGSAELPAEAVHAGLLVMGQRRPPHFTEPKPPAFDAWDAKGLAELLADAAFEDRDFSLRAGGEGTLWEIVRGGTVAGTVVRVDLDAPVWASPAFGVELRLSDAPLDPAAPAGQSPAAASKRRYRPIPVTPAAELDLALLIPSGITAAEVEAVIRRAGGELLERLELFDEFKGPGLPAGTRSIAWRLTFRHPERTLRDKEVEGRRDKLLRTLENELSVRQRTS